MAPVMQHGERPQGPRRSRRGNRAFIIETLVLFVFLIVSFAVIVRLYVGSAIVAQNGLDLERAVACAGNVAERFSADPLATNLDVSDDKLTVTCEVTPESMTGGTLYRAHITATVDDVEVYTLDTARYVSGVSR